MDDRDDPRAQLAAALTDLRLKVGKPPYRRMVSKLQAISKDAVGPTALRNAAWGTGVPRLDTVTQFVSACRLIARENHIALDEALFASQRWRELWQRAVPLDAQPLPLGDAPSPGLSAGQPTSHQIPRVHGSDADDLQPWVGLVQQLGADGHLPRVSNLDPYQLGAVPTQFGSVGHSGPSLDPYVQRTASDVDARLAKALTGPTMVVVIGWSMVGKTRTLFEAVRRQLPEARVLVPEPTALHKIPQHAAYTRSSETIVVWLDDLDEYLQEDQALGPTWLTHMRAAHPGRTVVAATLRREAYKRLRDATGELTRDARTLLNHATRITLESTSDDHDELARAMAIRGYRDLHLERYQELGYGLGEVLAGAPALLERYDDADPRLRAVIQVSVDWRRIGRSDPIPEPVLIDLADRRARTLQRNLGLDPGATAAAIVTARESVETTARIAALDTVWFSDTDCGYRAFDYLVAADDGQHGRRERPIPDGFWDVATHSADPKTLAAVGSMALLRDEIEHATRILYRAAVAGDPVASHNLGIRFRASGNPEQAEYWWRKAAEAGHPGAMNNLAILLNDDDRDFDEAEGWWYRAAEGGDPQAMHNLAVRLREYGDTEDADQWLRKAAAAGSVGGMFTLALLFEHRGDLENAENWLRKAAEADHAAAMNSLAVMLKRRGDFAEAEKWYRRAATFGNVDAMNNLAILLEGSNDLEQAEKWYRRADAGGHPDAMYSLGNLLKANGHLEDAEAAWRKAAAAGNADAMNNLGALLHDTGDSEQAEPWLHQAAAAGGLAAVLNYAVLLEGGGRDREAEDWYRKAAEGGVGNAMFPLANLLQSRGATEEATKWWHRAGVAGDPRVLAWFRQMRSVRPGIPRVRGRWFTNY
ncbi:SEL1-like repeat protein (plasmid) [Nocardia sp. CA-084685]|uniref:SEL1-like repeat protein n=1 Tax=Nocardia sp. CA-084685 TaxID=3239970 RepID=UPI003D988B71